MTHRWTALAGLLLAFALIAAACGDSGEDTTPETTPPATEATTPETTPPETTPPETTPPETTPPETTPPDPEVEPLLIWADETRVSVIEGVAADFEAATGVPVEIELVGFGDIRGNMVTQGPVGEGADVFIGAHDWIGELAVNGIVGPITLGDAADQFFPVALDAFSFEGQLYGLPYAIEAIGLYRNVDLVPDAPATLEELLAVCADLADQVQQCLATPAGGDAYHHYPFLASTGGYIFQFTNGQYDVGDIGLDNEGAVEGFTIFDELVKDGALDPAVDYGTMTDLFFNGNAAFMWTGPWELPNVQEAGINYAVSPLPDIGGNTAVPFVGVQGFFVNEFSDQKALAQTFVLDFIANQDVMVQLYDVGLRAPAHIPSFDQVSADPDVQAFGASAGNGNPMPNVPEMAAVWGALGNAVQEIYNQAADPLSALTNAQTAVEEALG